MYSLVRNLLQGPTTGCHTSIPVLVVLGTDRSKYRTSERNLGKTVGVTFRISSRVCKSGERPPWTQKNCLFMTAASGRAQNEFIHAS
jgi:hypothetical protein